jgi:putative transposase
MPPKGKTIPVDIKCKFCGSHTLVRYGDYSGIRRYLCRACGRKMANNRAWPGQRVPPEVIGTALTMFYEGLSLSNISRQIWQLFNIEPSKSTLYGWLLHYSRVADNIASELKPCVGGTLVVDETELQVGGQYVCFWDVIDTETRFLAASHLAIARTSRNAQSVMKQARNRVIGTPEFIISDKLAAYLDGIERESGTDMWYIHSAGLRGRINNSLVEQFHETLKPRAKIMDGLRNRKTVKSVLSGFLIYYNFIRPHDELDMKTPAQVAGLTFPYTTWELLVTRKDTNGGS